MTLKELLTRIFKRSADSGKSLDLDYMVAEKPADLIKYKKLKEVAHDLLVERYAIEQMDAKTKPLALSVWWRRFHKHAALNPEYFPKIEDDEIVTNLALLDSRK
ncbi:hypothetical protein [Aliikangiella coralliicola]|uniref:Uncharacterized protein n=1 Tax=Aliikangiella coralliicola TaxID=2592383 RepID=A0A545U037_9GAMM|nr:hypothetical protein [Aliikangiella coralliicola]TQV82829.1 hypothetical protein FLL46_23970 [Aliikangiella coralliicola]